MLLVVVRSRRERERQVSSSSSSNVVRNGDLQLVEIEISCHEEIQLFQPIASFIDVLYRSSESSSIDFGNIHEGLEIDSCREVEKLRIDQTLRRLLVERQATMFTVSSTRPKTCPKTIKRDDSTAIGKETLIFPKKIRSPLTFAAQTTWKDEEFVL
jgi:hypothetical protein